MAEGKLILCPTPLGNLGDMTERTLRAFGSCDAICCEDTRVTGKLLAALGIEGKRLERLDEEMVAHKATAVIERVLAGDTIAYCSDAGMPGVSDPGQRLVAKAHELGAPVEVLPGPSAAITAYVASGFATPQFYFGGFFPRKAGARSETLAALSPLDAVLIFYESPNRIIAALEAVAEALPLRQVAVCRELTKVHEEVLLGTAAEVAAELASRDAVKGEVVLVIDAPGSEEVEAGERDALVQAETKARDLLAQGTMTPKDVVRAIREEFGLSRNDAYSLVQSLK